MALLRGPKIAWIVLVCGLIATTLVWKLAADSEDRRVHEIFRHRVAGMTAAVKSRVKVYEQVLWGGVGLFQASDSVTRKDWKSYVDALKLQDHWPGIQGLGWSVPVAPGEKQDFVSKVRAEGFPAFDIQPQEARDQYTAIVFLEPFDWRNKRAFGFDMWSKPTQREAMIRARDRGVASISGAITLVQETDQDVQRGFVTYVPVYRRGRPTKTAQDRQANFEGWIYAAFRAGDLMNGILSSTNFDLNFEIYDGATEADNLLYDTNPKVRSTEVGHIFRQVEKFQLQGRAWTIFFTATDQFAGAEVSKLSTLIALMGLVIDGLLFYLISTLLLFQRRAEDTVEERTAELLAQTRQLRATNEELHRSNTDLERFASVASHDLQEPLRSITSFCQLLELDHSNALNEEGREYLGYVLRSSDQMRHLIQDLLTFSRVRAIIDEPIPVVTSVLVDTILSELTVMLQAVKVKVEVDDLPTVQAGPTLRHVFLNLIVNAITYRDRPEGFVKVSAEREGDFWKFCVADDGLGVEPKFREQIFELFERLHTREDYAGTGLGLAVCRRVVESFGGRMWMESNEPRGSLFYFTLPVTQ